MKVFIDDREKKPWNFAAIATQSTRLHTGDYTVEGLEDNFIVERKSLDDLVNSLLGDKLAQFQLELQRMTHFKWRWVVIESSIEALFRAAYYAEVKPLYILEQVAINSLFFNVPFIWTGTRRNAVKWVVQHALAALGQQMTENLTRQGLDKSVQPDHIIKKDNTPKEVEHGDSENT